MSDIENNGATAVFDVSGNAAFQGIDSFLIEPASGNNVTGLIGIGKIDATGFQVPGPSVTVDPGIGKLRRR